jgi:hypothetical protein
MATGAAAAIGGGLMACGLTAAGKGLIAGALFSVLNFVLMGQGLEARLGRSRRRATLAAFGTLVPRMLLMAVPLALAFAYRRLDPVATAIGLFAIQLVILAEQLFLTLSRSAHGDG